MVKWTENINGEPYTSRGVRTVRGRVLGNTTIVIWKGAGYLAYIATVNISEGGQRIETHNIGKNQSEKARKAIEELYGLVKAEDQKKPLNYIPDALPLEAVNYGKRETKAAISSVVREVVDSYKFTSLPELNAILRQFNIRAFRGAENTQMYQKGGLVYGMLDGNGLPVGIPIKASAIFGRPTLQNLEKRYVPNQAIRKPYRQRLRYLLDKAVSSSRSMDELQDQLRGQGVRILLRENAQGQVYGVTFIDNATRTVFNGSDLGKEYSAKLFMQRLSSAGTHPLSPQTINNNTPVYIQQQPRQRDMLSGTKGAYPASRQPVIVRLKDELFNTEYEDTNLDPFKKRKRRRLQND